MVRAAVRNRATNPRVEERHGDSRRHRRLRPEFWLARLELQDSVHGPLSFRLEARHLTNSALVLGRSKKPGEKHIYWIYGCPYPGSRIELKWIAD